MAIGFRACSSGVNACESQTTCVPSYPAGIASGDLCLLCVQVNDNAHSIIAAPAGWTLLQSLNTGAPLGQSFYLWWHQYSPGDAAPALSWANSASAVAWVMAAFAEAAVYESAFIAGENNPTTDYPVLPGQAAAVTEFAAIFGSCDGNATTEIADKSALGYTTPANGAILADCSYNSVIKMQYKSTTTGTGTVGDIGVTGSTRDHFGASVILNYAAPAAVGSGARVHFIGA